METTVLRLSAAGALILGLVLSRSASGAPAVAEWVQRYNGPANYSDVANALAVDAQGQVFVTGYSYKDAGASMDYATLAYSSAGVPWWTNRYAGPGTYHTARALAVDRDGNVLVTGYSQGSSTYPYNRDYATLKYSNAGVPLWTNRYDGTGNDDEAAAIAVDASGRVFVTGYSYSPGSAKDYLTLAYSATGTPLWANRYNGPGNDSDQAAALVVDGEGNVVVTGASTGSGSGYDYATVKYSNAGVPLWSNRYNGPENGDDEATAVAVDSQGNVFVTGGSGLGPKSGLDYVTIAYSSTGVPLWTNRYSEPGSSSVDRATAIAVDGNGNVFVTGGASNGSHGDFLTLAYSGAGVPLWTNRYNGQANGADSAKAIALDGNGNVFVTGTSYGTNGQPNYATLAYSNTGLPLWTNRYVGTGNYNDTANAIAVDAGGDVLVTGGSWGLSGAFDYVTIKYSVLSPIPLALRRVGDQVVLSWTNAAFALQTAPAANGVFTNLPGAASPYTQSLTGAQQFFRLKAGAPMQP